LTATTACPARSTARARSLESESSAFIHASLVVGYLVVSMPERGDRWNRPNGRVADAVAGGRGCGPIRRQTS
jgi:hypothetical protein